MCDPFFLCTVTHHITIDLAADFSKNHYPRGTLIKDKWVASLARNFKGKMM